MSTRNRRSQQGNALVEFALVFLLFLTLMVGLMEMGRMVWAYSTIDHATRQGARYAMAHGSLNAATADQIQNVVLSNAVGLDPKKIVVKTTWSPSNQRGNIVQVQGRYQFTFVTTPLILKTDTLWLGATAQAVVAN
jgi:Flp pilus assembly protein TadG